jgi:hypothetical protein
MIYKKIFCVSVQCWETVSAQVARAWPIHEREKLNSGKKYTQPRRVVICHVGPSWSAAEFPSET